MEAGMMVVETGVKTARKRKQGRGLLMLKPRTIGFNILEKEFELASRVEGSRLAFSH